MAFSEKRDVIHTATNVEMHSNYLETEKSKDTE